MMIILQNVFIFFITILPCVASQSPIGCNRSCPNGEFNQVPYPFGFSSGCEIQLNCTSNRTVLIGEFPIQQFNSDKLIVTLPTKCGHSADTISHLYSEHHAPMSANAILMENCTEQTTNCMLPVPISQFRTAIVNCSIHGYGNTSCYAGDVRTGMFLDYGNVTGMGCRFLLTGFVSKRVGGIGPPPSMTRAVELGWWVKGSCNCSDGADCTQIVSPVDGSDGFRCNCKSGLEGDGYKSSIGCQKFKGMPSFLLLNT
ncbi:hypothetical protein Tco_1154647 [Tanacetum coccineum]